jgi:DNA-directed RNA polymerase specialized sigma24 family protein
MGNEVFPSTHWSQVLAAASPDPERARAAALELCGGYREAIRTWFQRDTRTRQEAEDLAHDFLTRWLVRKAPLGRFVRGERRFREFLGGYLRRFAIRLAGARPTA